MLDECYMYKRCYFTDSFYILILYTYLFINLVILHSLSVYDARRDAILVIQCKKRREKDNVS